MDFEAEQGEFRGWVKKKDRIINKIHLGAGFVKKLNIEAGFERINIFFVKNKFTF